MALSDLNWRFVGTRPFGYALQVNGALDAIFNLGISNIYADGSARVPGTDSAWTWEREVPVLSPTVSVYGNPPINAMEMRYIIGGTTALPSLAGNLAAPDTTVTAALLYYGMNRASVTFGGWTAANPFGNAGGFSKYWRGSQVFAGQYISASMWECQEACVIQLNTSAGASSVIAFGALFDPLSYQVGLSCETDGRLYYMGGTGSIAYLNGAWMQNNDANILGPSSNTASAYHMGYFSPGTNTLVQTARFGAFPNLTMRTFSANGALPLIPYAVTSSAGAFLGQSRNFYQIRNTITGGEPRSASPRIGSVLGYGLEGLGNSVLFAR